MKKSILEFTSLACIAMLAAVVSCVKENEISVESDGAVITATATMPVHLTKAIYEDAVPSGDGIKAGWENGDQFVALEINGRTVTPVTFTATASMDVKASFTSEGAVRADASTKWVAVLGKGASANAEGIFCSYKGQDGSLKGLFQSDFVVASSTGETPDFNYSNGQHLSYLLRIVMPAGVGLIEFNTCHDDNEWQISSDSKTNGCKIDYRPKATRIVQLTKETKAGDCVYLEVPAADYSDAGLIVTIMNKEKTKSQGKVLSENLTDKGGHLGTFDMSELVMMDRTTAEDAIDFISDSKSTLQFINNDSYSGIKDIYTFANKPKWATFNLGASANPTTAEEFYGMYVAWGETEQKEAFSWDNYHHSEDHSSIGFERSYIGDSDNTLRLQNISGTKYDAARVKWGSEWRMPFLEEMLGLIGNNESFDTESGSRKSTSSGYSTIDVKTYNGVDVAGRTFTRNGRTLFLPFAGRYYYSDGGTAEECSHYGKIGYYFSGTHCNIAGCRTAYKLLVRGTQVEVTSWEAGYGLPIRPVLAEDTDHAAEPATVSGKISDAKSGNGIAGVTVSDGYNCCKTGADGTYRLEADARARTINVTVPSDYEIPLGQDGRPAFYKSVSLTAGSDMSVDFTLTPRKSQSGKFTLIAVSDAHVQNSSNLKQFKTAMADVQNTVTELEKSGDAGEIIGIALGDQLWDNMAMAAEVRKEYTALKNGSGNTMPFFYCIGNHDHDSEAGTKESESTAVFVENFSPTDYSFDIGNAHIIVMDDIEFNGNIEGGAGGHNMIKYRERITGEQLHWLKQDIANVSNKESKVGIFCTHAPVYSAIGNSEAIRSLMNQFSESHILSGHIHNLTNFYTSGFKGKSGKVLIEHNIQSMCGMWWLADLSPNGTPAGYGVFTFDGATLSREFNKVWKEDKSFQMRAYSGNDSYDSYAWGNEYKGKILLRIWDGDAPSQPVDDCNWSVKFIRNGITRDMTKLTQPLVDKCAAGYIVRKLGSPYGTGGNASSYSWWVIDVPVNDPAELDGWKIVATHRIPGGWSESYTTTGLVRDYNGYACGSRFDIYSSEPVTPPSGGGDNEGTATSPSLGEDN